MTAWRVTQLARRTLTDGEPRARTTRSRVEVPGSWRCVLTRVGDDLVVARDRDVARIDGAGRLVWPAVRTLAGIAAEAHVSADRLLVTTDSLEYTAWGNLGPALLLDLRDGALIAELRGERAAAAGGGRFLLGLEGYDVFDTWLYERDGRLLRGWRSYGHYVVDPDGSVRVVECDRRTPTRARVVRLLADGSIERGPALADGQTSRPLQLEDGTILLLDAGKLRAVDRSLQAWELAELLAIPPGETWRYSGALCLEGSTLLVVLHERTPDAPIEYRTHCWSLELSRPGE